MGRIKPISSKQRVMDAFSLKESDRIPLDLSGHRSSGVSAMVYPKLREYLDLAPSPVRVYDPIQQLAVLDDDILDLFNIDTIELGRAFLSSDQDWHQWELPDGSKCFLPKWVIPEREKNRWIICSDSGRIIAQMPDGAQFFEQVYYPLYQSESESEKGGKSSKAGIRKAMQESMWHTVTSPPGPLVEGEGGWTHLKERAAWIRNSTDRAIIGLFGGNLLETGQMLYRNDQFLLNLAMDPTGVHDFLDRLTEIHLEDLERFLGAIENNIDIILFGDDLGMQSGPQMSPEMYREYFKPRHQMMWKRAKELADVKVMLHCCGGVRELLPDLIDAGLDAINPVQITARGMEAAGLKKDFGKDILFWGGGCDTQQLLPNATTGEIKEHVRRQLEVLSPGGGFVFQQVHNILPGVPPENIVAMLEAVNNFK